MTQTNKQQQAVRKTIIIYMGEVEEENKPASFDALPHLCNVGTNSFVRRDRHSYLSGLVIALLFIDLHVSCLLVLFLLGFSNT